jgi:hypothetical protein
MVVGLVPVVAGATLKLNVSPSSPPSIGRSMREERESVTYNDTPSKQGGWCTSSSRVAESVCCADVQAMGPTRRQRPTLGDTHAVLALVRLLLGGGYRISFLISFFNVKEKITFLQKK